MSTFHIDSARHQREVERWAEHLARCDFNDAGPGVRAWVDDCLDLTDVKGLVLATFREDDDRIHDAVMALRSRYVAENSERYLAAAEGEILAREGVTP